jgi:hypothetical protein
MTLFEAFEFRHFLSWDGLIGALYETAQFPPLI